MKKKLEADLISIAHKILQLKNKSDINQLFLETQKLYEKLAVLRFIDTHYGEAKPTIGYSEIENEVAQFFDKDAELPIETVIEMKESFPAENSVVEKNTEEEPEIATAEETIAETIETAEEEESIIEAILEEKNEEIANEVETTEEESEIKDKIEEIIVAESTAVEEIEEKENITPAFKAAFELSEEVEIDTPKKTKPAQISFEDLLGMDYTEPLFVKVDEKKENKTITEEVIPSEPELEKKTEKTIEVATPKSETKKVVSLNDKLSKGIDIDLNDRIAFVKHLFGNSNEDYNRVLNQLITFDTFYETKSFIDEMVKPDYNNWEGKDDYVDRFMEIIEKKFL